MCLMGTLYATPLTVPKMSASDEQEALYTIGTIELQNGMLFLKDKSGVVLYCSAVNQVRSIVLQHSPEAITDPAAPHISAYPNPTTAILHLSGVEEDEAWHVFDLQGRMLYHGKGAQVPAERLPQGQYLLQVQTQIIKFIKR